MNKKFLCVCLAAFLSQSALSETDLATCYRKATNKAQYQDCLETEYKLLKKEYDDVLERVLAEAQSLDRVHSKKQVAKTFNDANKSFDRYLKDECGFLESTSGKTSSKSGVELSCRINLMRVRMGSMRHIYLNPQ